MFATQDKTDRTPALTAMPILHHGDCIDRLAEIAPHSIDLVMTDPPYVCRFRDRSGRTVANDNHAEWIAPAFREIHRVMKPDTVCISFYGWQHVERFMLAWKAAGFRPVGHLVWTKRYASSTRYLEARHEQAYVLAKGEPPTPDYPLPDVAKWLYTGNALHPTQKAVGIIRPLIESFSRPGDTVLDPFMGACSAGIAALESGRKFVGIELDPVHYATACERVAKFREACRPRARLFACG